MFSDKLNESQLSKGSKGSKGLNSSKMNIKDQLNTSKDSLMSKDDFKYEIPERCYLILMKGTKIEKLHKKFALLSHPFPKIEGELIVFQPVKQD
jgi:hypothetical protein